MHLDGLADWKKAVISIQREGEMNAILILEIIESINRLDIHLHAALCAALLTTKNTQWKNEIVQIAVIVCSEESCHCGLPKSPKAR